MDDPPDKWKVERDRFREAVDVDDPGGAFYALGRIRALADCGELEHPAWAHGWAMRRIRWLYSRLEG